MNIIQADMKVGEHPTSDILKDTYGQFAARLADFRKYREYYEGDHDFGDRKGAKVTVNLVRYGIDNLVSYMAGNAPNYIYKDGDKAAEEIIERYDKQNLKERESEIVRDLKIYGRAYELVYHSDEEGNPPRSAVVSPEQAFVVYDMTIDPDSVFGAIVRTVKGKDDKQKMIMDVYGPNWYEEWVSEDGGDWTRTRTPNDSTRFTRVPLIEYLNSEDAMSEVDNVMSLQDALNAVMSDRQDDKDAFAGAMLALYGFSIGLQTNEIKENRKVLKDQKVLQFEDRTKEGAEYLIKQMDETGAQTYSTYLSQTIHKLMRVPDFSDESFAGNASGVAMAYKLYGTHNAAKVTELYFGRGFRRRCKLYDSALHNALQNENTPTVADVTQMSIVFTYSTVVDPQAEAQAAEAYLRAGVSQETVLNNLSIVDNVEEEMKRLAKQKAEDLAREKTLMEDEFSREEPPADEEE